MSHVYILHENDAWTAPLRAELDRLEVPTKEWFLDEGLLDLTSAPPDGVFYNRMSASSHTRGHRYAAEYTASVLSWLERYDRVVVNDWRAMQLEISKIAQYQALERHGIRTPATIAAIGRRNVVEAARVFAGRPFITKHTRAGKGLGVRLFETMEALENYVSSDAFEEPIDGITLVQEYIAAPDRTITRCEFVGGKFLYAVRVDTSDGFELCPADACRVDEQFCPADGGAAETRDAKPLFEIIDGFHHPEIPRFEAFLAANGMKIAAIELIRDAAGASYVYDVNVNTNYNSDAEERAGKSGMRAIATFLGEELVRTEAEALVRAC